MARLPPERLPEGGPAGWEGLDGLDRLLEHRVRLATCVLLSRYERLNFRRLKDLLDETDGSLGAHLRKLEDAGYVSVQREFEGRKPVSWYRLTAAGAGALREHTRLLEALLDQARAGTTRSARPKRRRG